MAVCHYLAALKEALAASANRPLNIGIIGSGRIGGAIGKRWAAAGHQILFSSRNPDQLGDLVGEAGSNARAGTPLEAVEFGEVVLIAVPYGAMPQLSNDFAALLKDKIVIDCGYPRADRDGPMADEAIAKGTGIALAEYFPGAKLTLAFNAVSAAMVDNQAYRQGELIGIPLAGDDVEVVAVTEQLIRDTGFETVLVGSLETAGRFDRGTDVYVRGMTAAELRLALGLKCCHFFLLVFAGFVLCVFPGFAPGFDRNFSRSGSKGPIPVNFRRIVFSPRKCAWITH